MEIPKFYYSAEMAKFNQIQPIVQVWGQMTPAQRLVYLEHSPILKALLDFAKQFEGVE